MALLREVPNKDLKQATIHAALGPEIHMVAPTQGKMGQAAEKVASISRRAMVGVAPPWNALQQLADHLRYRLVRKIQITSDPKELDELIPDTVTTTA